MAEQRLPDPSACSWCERPARGHDDQFFLYRSGRHSYCPPRSSLIKARMKGRRTARLAPRGKSRFPLDQTPAITLELRLDNSQSVAAIRKAQAALGLAGEEVQR